MPRTVEVQLQAFDRSHSNARSSSNAVIAIRRGAFQQQLMLGRCCSLSYCAVSVVTLRHRPRFQAGSNVNDLERLWFEASDRQWANRIGRMALIQKDDWFHVYRRQWGMLMTKMTTPRLLQDRCRILQSGLFRIPVPVQRRNAHTRTSSFISCDLYAYI